MYYLCYPITPYISALHIKAHALSEYEHILNTCAFKPLKTMYIVRLYTFSAHNKNKCRTGMLKFNAVKMSDRINSVDAIKTVQKQVSDRNVEI